MDTLAPGHYWKTPFIWEPGCPQPPNVSVLRYEPASEPWLRESIAAVMTHSLDESDQYTVGKNGIDEAVEEVYEVSAKYFEPQAGWWRAAIDRNGNRVGFVLTSVFAERSRWKEDRPQGTIVYMGVLPGFLGHGYALELVLEATRTCMDANCWRVFCDTGSDNHPMVGAFRKAGYQERKPWQRPLG
jgi:ribosomal protein S18 acetylase RimI-like enzyme